jgi:hypothetical protein
MIGALSTNMAMPVRNIDIANNTTARSARNSPVPKPRLWCGLSICLTVFATYIAGFFVEPIPPKG